MTAAIEINEISKRFLINHLRSSNGSASRKSKRSLLDTLLLPIKSLRQGAALGSVEEFWALQDVTFSVDEGDVVGIVGRNGAGKSTLLKILSRITEPTQGSARLRGRVGSLLEVGTGFHPELTGRENVFLNGSILGMGRGEIMRKFDQIVDFSGVEKFLDTPVKRYSSGMKVRLAFAVAAHLDLEILLVDEVLSVGDAEFQHKCLGKMNDAASSGRTVIFISHNMSAVRTLCRRVIHLREGRVVDDGDSAEVIHRYLEETFDTETAPEMDLTNWPRKGSGEARLVHARLLDVQGNCTGQFNRLGPLTLEFTLESHSRSRLNLSAVCMTTDESIKVLQLDHHDTPGFTPDVVAGQRTVRIQIESLPLQAGEYQWALGIHSETSMQIIDLVYDVLPFMVRDDLTTSPRPYRSSNQNGLCSLLAHWGFVDRN